MNKLAGISLILLAFIIISILTACKTVEQCEKDYYEEYTEAGLIPPPSKAPCANTIRYGEGSF
jgi:hypothetical protein